MERFELASQIGTPMEIDVCGPCHVIWFDNLESASRSPGSVIESFKCIYAARNSARNELKLKRAVRVPCRACENSHTIKTHRSGANRQATAWQT
jgi:ribosomal protein L31